MILPNTFPTRFTRIDELTLGQHVYLTQRDECYYLGQYTPRAGYEYSKTNSVILNFKKSTDRQDKHSEWKYKERAIDECAEAFAAALKAFETDAITFVTVPPSKIESNPLYDDRLESMLERTREIIGILDIRTLIKQTENLQPSHESEIRPKPSEIAKLYDCMNDSSAPRPKQIAIVDDVLTTGAHFKAMESILSDQYPGVKLIGLFLARCEFPQ